MRDKSRQVTSGVSFICGLLFLAGCSANTTQAPANKPAETVPNTSTNQAASSDTALTTVTIGDKKAPSGAGLILGDQLGFFKQQGIQIKFQNFKSGADQLQALASGQIDVGRTVIEAGLFNAVSRGIGIKLVADGGQNLPGKSYFTLVLKKGLENKVNNYADLKGLKIGIASSGSINQLMAEKALEKGGLTGKDINEVVVNSFPDLNTAIENGAIDGAMQIEPLVAKGVAKGTMVRFSKDATDYAPNEEVSVLEYSPQFAGKTDLATRFMTAYLQGVRAFDDAFIYGNKDRDKITEILSKETGIDKDSFAKMYPPLLNPNGKIPVDGVQGDLNWYMQHGYTKQSVDMKKLIDESFAENAVKKLGAYDKH